MRLGLGLLMGLMTGLLTSSTQMFCTGAWAAEMRVCTYDIEPFTGCDTAAQWFGDEYTCLSNRSAVLDAVRRCDCDAGLGLFDSTDNVSIVGYVYGTTFVAVEKRVDKDGELMWTIFSPFTPGLWLLVLATPGTFAVFMTLFSWAISRYKQKTFSLGVLPQFIFQNTLSLLNDYTDVQYRLDWKGKKPYMSLLKVSLQTMMVAYAFLCLVVTSLYTAQLTNILLMEQSSSMREQSVFMHELSSLDLKQTMVPKGRLSSFLTSAQRFDVETEAVLDALGRLTKNDASSIILPYESAIWAVRHLGMMCDVTVRALRGGVVTAVNLVVSPCTANPLGVARTISSALFIWRLSTYAGDFEAERVGTCSTMPRVSIQQISGGWVILAIAVSIPLCLMLTRYVWYLTKKFVESYGSFFVLAFSSSSDEDSTSSNPTAS